MNKKDVTAARREAEEFIRRAKLVEAIGDDYWIYADKRRAAMRRQSMELTRALATLRKGER